MQQNNTTDETKELENVGNSDKDHELINDGKNLDLRNRRHYDKDTNWTQNIEQESLNRKSPATAFGSNTFFVHQDQEDSFDSYQESSDVPILHLGNFQESLWLNFGEEKYNTVGKSHSLSFALQAPSQNSNNGKRLNRYDDDFHTLKVEKVPVKKGFTLTRENCDDDTNVTKSLADPFYIKEGEKEIMTLTWKPTCAGGVRETIYIKMQRGRIRIIAHGKAKIAPKRRKKTVRVSYDICFLTMLCLYRALKSSLLT
jgi:hypothetical protein